jgi:hypothetical protein
MIKTKIVEGKIPEPKIIPRQVIIDLETVEDVQIWNHCIVCSKLNPICHKESEVNTLKTLLLRDLKRSNLPDECFR